MPEFDADNPWWDDWDAEDVSDSVRGILQDRIEEESTSEQEEEEDLVELDELDDEQLAEEIEEDEEEEAEEEIEEEEFEDIQPVEAEDDAHLAPDNEAQEDWELAHHFDFYEDASNYCAGVAEGVLYIVINDDGSADVYRDPDYEAVAA